MLIERIDIAPGTTTASWPFSIPSVEHMARSGLTLTSNIVILAGPNGSGKSTIIEGIAEAYGIDVRGGHGNRRYASNVRRSILGDSLRLHQPRTKHRNSAGFFLRAETAFGMLSYMTEAGVPGYGQGSSSLRSHGETYLDAMTGRFNDPGLYLLDEAEGPLSFESTLAMMYRLIDLSRMVNTQVIYATHSPMVAALPGAQILSLSDEGITGVTWEQLPAVGLWRSFLSDPSRFVESS